MYDCLKVKSFISVFSVIMFVLVWEFLIVILREFIIFLVEFFSVIFVL